MNGFPWLTVITFLPLVCGLAVLACRPRAARVLALAATLVELILVAALAFKVTAGTTPGGWLMVEDSAWIPAFGIRYTLALDGISLLFVALTAVFGVLCVLVSWNQVTKHVGAFHFAVLAALSAVYGVFLATDLFLFALFWEAQIIPLFFIIGIWGHGEKERAAIKFFLYSAAGGLLMFLAVIGLGLIHARATGTYSFALADLIGTAMAPRLGFWLFGAFVLSFAVKLPAVPVHMWLPDAHTQAPTAGSLILAALLLKTGGYALLRFAFPLFPAQAMASAPLLMVLGLAGLFFASWVALAQEDFKRLVAYSSISHMGLVLLGLAAGNELALTGAIILMVCHGLTTGGLFAMAGMVEERLGTRELARLGGLWGQAPVFGALMLIFALASAALPGLCNFVGEIMIVFGLFKSSILAGALAVVGMVLTLVYILRLARDTLFGPPRQGPAVADLGLREALVLVPLALLALAIGLHPGPITELIAAPVHHLVSQTATAASLALGW
jgi:NADH-quinone oxidoreductase subunit M